MDTPPAASTSGREDLLPRSTPAQAFTDLGVRRAVEAELAWTPGISAPAIGVSVEGGVVTLTGEVATLHERIAALGAAQRVAGVRTVADELTLPDGGTDPGGRRLAAAVDAILAWTSGVPREGIHADVEGHRVILSGTVDWDAQRVAAKRAVERICGVHAVESRIELTRKPQAENVEEEIRHAIVRNAILDSRRITATVIGDEVTLRGSVRSWAERRQAVRTAWSSPHVREVTDLLRVEPDAI
ncbi:ornithine aminotransferase [Leifsonia sp. LS1]|uniref:BON domain-containing protein n=1 Tax=Leifsonia sp. LS1 TaxID=2828483 RepID=UPI001CFE9F5C|nr:BON domain-containing protein [Leifsonia sp. LS1]GIT81772.1 ornithine aminotransferase [Leifsonia sp. LS1]